MLEVVLEVIKTIIIWFRELILIHLPTFLKVSPSVGELILGGLAIAGGWYISKKILSNTTLIIIIAALIYFLVRLM